MSAMGLWLKVCLFVRLFEYLKMLGGMGGFIFGGSKPFFKNLSSQGCRKGVKVVNV